MNKKATVALLLAAGLVMSSQSAFAVVDGPKAQKPDENVITVVDESGQQPELIYAPDIAYIMIESPELAHLDGHWSQEALQHLVKSGVLNRNEAQAFNPKAEISKEDFQIWTDRILGKKDGAKQPAEVLTRVDAAVWLADLLPALNTGINGGNLKHPFSDTSDISAKQKSAIDYLYKLGIMVGNGNGKFAPKAKLTKGEAAVLVDKVLSRANQFAKPAQYDLVTGTVPETVQTIINENKTEAGVYTVEENGVRYVVISCGTVPNPGYGISLESVTESDGALFVRSGITAPQAGHAHPEVIAYPVLVLKTKPSNKPVFLLD
ncbi:S-layer family protein [Tumebacillus sp. BK434]|uniref:S-layer homology domain-containing protein n=1 Tax=Tumebacillus sp. BK434 TaxID=2512169 RepID=UPI00104D2313|nr:S-layer homology domain-containing protein [Tumebacillus sp. BK434]TCP59284.1 S-layer family protein [Tumebacillus sp. BK434]